MSSVRRAARAVTEWVAVSGAVLVTAWGIGSVIVAHTH